MIYEHCKPCVLNMLIFFDAQNLNAQVFHHPIEAFVVYLSLKFMIELKNKVHIKGQGQCFRTIPQFYCRATEFYADF